MQRVLLSLLVLSLACSGPSQNGVENPGPTLDGGAAAPDDDAGREPGGAPDGGPAGSEPDGAFPTDAGASPASDAGAPSLDAGTRNEDGGAHGAGTDGGFTGVDGGISTGPNAVQLVLEGRADADTTRVAEQLQSALTETERKYLTSLDWRVFAAEVAQSHPNNTLIDTPVRKALRAARAVFPTIMSSGPPPDARDSQRNEL